MGVSSQLHYSSYFLQSREYGMNDAFRESFHDSHFLES